jgi:hypothetical protein
VIDCGPSSAREYPPVCTGTVASARSIGDAQNRTVAHGYERCGKGLLESSANSGSSGKLTAISVSPEPLVVSWNSALGMPGVLMKVAAPRQRLKQLRPSLGAPWADLAVRPLIIDFPTVTLGGER